MSDQPSMLRGSGASTVLQVWLNCASPNKVGRRPQRPRKPCRLPASGARCCIRVGRAKRGGFHATGADRYACLPRAARRPGEIPRSRALVLLALSTVIRAAGTTAALGEAGKGVWGKTWNRAVIFRGRGGFRVSPSDSG